MKLNLIRYLLAVISLLLLSEQTPAWASSEPYASFCDRILATKVSAWKPSQHSLAKQVTLLAGQLAERPDDTTVRLQLAGRYRDFRYNDLSLATLQSPHADQKDPRILFALAQTYRFLGEPEKGLPLIQELNATTETRASLELQIALMKELGQATEAQSMKLRTLTLHYTVSSNVGTLTNATPAQVGFAEDLLRSSFSLPDLLARGLVREIGANLYEFYGSSDNLKHEVAALGRMAAFVQHPVLIMGHTPLGYTAAIDGIVFGEDGFPISVVSVKSRVTSGIEPEKWFENSFLKVTKSKSANYNEDFVKFETGDPDGRSFVFLALKKLLVLDRPIEFWFLADFGELQSSLVRLNRERWRKNTQPKLQRTILLFEDSAEDLLGGASR